jgi:hypothetical protein
VLYNEEHILNAELESRGGANKRMNINAPCDELEKVVM